MTNQLTQAELELAKQAGFSFRGDPTIEGAGIWFEPPNGSQRYFVHVAPELAKFAQLIQQRQGEVIQDRPLIARLLAEWHEDDGPVTWWAWCGNDWAGEPAWNGSPTDSDWPGYHTHWTPHPIQPPTIKEQS